jgi:hypothetical protein
MRITFLYEMISGQIDTIYQAAVSVGTLLHKKPVATVITAKQTNSKPKHYNLRARKPINYSE